MGIHEGPSMNTNNAFSRTAWCALLSILLTSPFIWKPNPNHPLWTEQLPRPYSIPHFVSAEFICFRFKSIPNKQYPEMRKRSCGKHPNPSTSPLTWGRNFSDQKNSSLPQFPIKDLPVTDTPAALASGCVKSFLRVVIHNWYVLSLSLSVFWHSSELARCWRLPALTHARSPPE